ncbi:hypothetical protein HYALB_00001910 [Hymenoscyphus albidus]|uniref:Uncharacterized protein n=1 Tax=Hymenoscyphus albidus TaxID=595503 RepID=A0A9N9LER6_9HELO|nr:hypothetical protein HYALB_00001910 [Hymenoscyphus albidus]
MVNIIASLCHLARDPLYEHERLYQILPAANEAYNQPLGNMIEDWHDGSPSYRGYSSKAHRVHITFEKGITLDFKSPTNNEGPAIIAYSDHTLESGLTAINAYLADEDKKNICSENSGYD